LTLVGVLPFNAQSEVRRRLFKIWNPPPKFAFVVLNYCGIAFASSGNSLKYRKVWSPEMV
jgi:hypothetical protein